MLVYLRLFKESFAFAINALKNNKLRTFLSLLGVTIGIFSIIAVLAAVDSLDKSIKDNLEGLDKNTMYITKISFGPTSVPRWQYENYPQTTYKEYEHIKDNVPNIQACAYAIFGNLQNIRYQDKVISGVNVTPVTSDIVAIDNIGMSKGRFYSEVESITGSSVAVIGYALAENLFENEEPIGKTIRIFGRKLTVVGVMKKYGDMFDSPDNKAFVPVNFVRQFYKSEKFGMPEMIVIRPERGTDAGALEEVIKQKLRVYRGLKADEPDNFFVNKLSAMTDFIDNIIGVLNMTGWIISGFSLLVGGFGIANIMFVSVKERTNLIGIQKSLGAKNRFILFQFLFEAIVLAFIGGLVGIVFVWIATLIASQLAGDFEFILSFGNIFLGFALSTLIGLVSGIIPAISASKLDPVEAIRTGI